MPDLQTLEMSLTHAQPEAQGKRFQVVELGFELQDQFLLLLPLGFHILLTSRESEKRTCWQPGLNSYKQSWDEVTP